MMLLGLATLAVVCLVSASVAQPTDPPKPTDPSAPPARIEANRAGRTAPVWLAAERAVRDGQELRLELFKPLERMQVQRELAGQRSRRQAGLLGSPDDPCRGATGKFAEYYVLNPSLADLVAHSEVAFSGTVRGGRPGFYRSDPRHLYTVQVDEVWIGAEHLSADEIAYVAFEEAQLRVGNDWLCVRGPRYPARPQPGKRILVFSHHAPWGTEPVFSPMDVELFFESQDGLSVPGHLVAELESPRFGDLEAAVADLVAESGGKR